MADATKKTLDAQTAGKELPSPPARPRRGIIQFFREVRREGIDKVTWPTFKETRLTTMMVFVMVGLTMVFFFIVDWLLNYAERLMIGAVS